LKTKTSLYLVIAGLLAAVLLTPTAGRSAFAVAPLTLSATTIPLGGTVDITYTNTLGYTLSTVAIVSLEPDGDVCRVLAHNVAAGDSFTVQYPTSFHPDLGSTACDTNQMGEFHVKSKAGNSAYQPDEIFKTNFFVVPESPIGVAALMGSSLAVLGAFVGLRRYKASSATTTL
jgi:hypothetical protein